MKIIAKEILRSIPDTKSTPLYLSVSFFVINSKIIESVFVNFQPASQKKEVTNSGVLFLILIP